MFIDEITGKVSKPGEKEVKVIVKTRPKQYFVQIKNKETREIETKLIAEGYEIVKEIRVTAETAAKLNEKTALT